MTILAYSQLPQEDVECQPPCIIHSSSPTWDQQDSSSGPWVASKAFIDAEPVPEGGDRGLRKWLTFWSCFVGYAVCYFTRQSLMYTAPALKEAMCWSGLGQLGQLSTVYPVAYGSSRFIGGVLSDRLSPKQVFTLGVAICGALNVAFGLSSSMPFFMLFWFLNGCFQGLAAPAVVKILANWFEPAERGKWWAVWHSSINVGGFFVPFLSGGLAEAYGWRYGMLGPGTIALMTAVACFALMRDAPGELVGMVVEEAGASKSLGKKAETEERVSFQEGLLAGPEQFALGICYLLCYVARQGLAVWGVFYLLHMAEESGARKSPALAASLFSGFELGGFCGNFTAGALSDFLFRRAGPEGSGPGQRVRVMGLYFFGASLLLPLFAKCPERIPFCSIWYYLALDIALSVPSSWHPWWPLRLHLRAWWQHPMALLVSRVTWVPQLQGCHCRSWCRVAAGRVAFSRP